MRVRAHLHRVEPLLVGGDSASIEPIVDRPLHWFALYTYWKTLPITLGVVTLFSLLPGVVALAIVTGFGLFYEFGDNLPAFLKDTVLEDVVQYELQGFGPIWDQLRGNHYRDELIATLAVLAVLWITVRTLQWHSTTYSVDSEHITIRGGLFWQWERRLPMERVQTIELAATWLDRILDLRSIEVTSSAPDRTVATIRLAAIPTAEAITIQQIVLAVTQESISDPEMDTDGQLTQIQLASISTSQLLAAGITSFEIRLSFVGALAVFHIFSKSYLKTWRNEFIDWFVNTIEQRHAFADLVDFTLLLLFVFWVLSVITFVATFSRFQLQRLGPLALIEHGLVTRRWRAVLLTRVQAITFVETPPQEKRHTGSLRMELAGSHQKSLDRRMLLPSLPRDQALGTLERLFGGKVFENIGHQLGQFQRIPASSRNVYALYWPYRCIGLAAFLSLVDYLSPDVRFEHETLAFIALLSIPGYFYGRRQFQDAGWLINDERELIVRERHINRRTIICRADRLQWRGLRQMTLPGRTPGPATVVAYVAASGKVDSVGRAYMPVGWPIYDGRLRVRGLSGSQATELLEQMGPQPDEPFYRPNVV